MSVSLFLNDRRAIIFTCSLIVRVLSDIPSPSWVFAQSGRFETTRFDSPALAGNQWGDPSERSVRVYLPPSYRSSEKRYPVLYLLPGTGEPQQMTSAADVLGNANSLIRAHSMQEMIIVEVDDRANYYGYGAYTNSAVQGNHADYVAENLVHHIDTTYRTVAERDSRGVAGFSLGGHGTLKLAMQRSDVFGAAYAINAGPLCFSRPECSEQLFEETARFSERAERTWGVTLAEIAATHGSVTSPNQVSDDIDFSMAAAFSPNVNNPPLFVDFPYELNEGVAVIPEIRDKWYQHDLLHILADHAEDLASLRGLAIDIADQDATFPESQLFHQALTNAGVPHDFTIYPGGHLTDWSGRFALAARFFSDTLVSPEPLRACDFNIDASCDVDDVDRLITKIREGSDDRLYDLNNSGAVELGDLEHFIVNEIGTWLGDANLDGEFSSGDLVDVFGAGKYDTGLEATWSEGDWNADGLFDSGDLTKAFQNGGYEQGPLPAAAAVPEPTALSLVAVALAGLAFLGRVKGRHFVRIEGRVRLTSQRSAFLHGRRLALGDGWHGSGDQNCEGH